jgi:hypothetical protein
MSETFDLDALEVEGENGEPFTFTYKGESYTMPNAAAMPWQDQIALETANTVESLRLILGDEQFGRFQKQAMSAGRLNGLIRKWMDHQGLKPGE